MSLCSFHRDLGGFTPQPSTPGASLTPKTPSTCLFRRGTPPERGSSRLSVSIAVAINAIDTVAITGCFYFKKARMRPTLARNAGIGRLYNQL